MCDDQLKETNLEILHRIILLIAYHIYEWFQLYVLYWYVPWSKKIFKGPLQGPSGTPTLAPASKGWIPAYHATYSDPMDQSHTLDPAPEPHSTNLRVRSDYKTVIDKKKSPQKEEMGREKAVLPIGGWFEGHPSDLSLRRLHNQVVSDNCLAGGVEQ